MPKIPVPKGLVFNTTSKKIKIKEKKAKKRKKKKLSAQRRKIKNKGKWARTKGHGFEREVAIMFRDAGYPKACRQLEYQEGKGVDLANTGIYQVQCKRTKKYVPMNAIKEIPFAEGMVPVLVAKADHDETLVALPIAHFIELIKVKDQGEHQHEFMGNKTNIDH